MAVTSGDLALYKPAIDEQGWGTNVNGNFDTIDTAVTARSVPAGSVFMTARTTAPTGYLLCDGSAISRVTYATLFTAISTTFGVGDGATTFNIPDTRGRSPMGAGTGSGLTARTLAANVGAQTVTLAASDIAPHTHGVTDPGHSHSLEVEIANYTGGLNHGVDASGSSTAGYITSATTGISIPSAGGTATGATNPSIVQPNLIFNFIIKT